MPVDVSQKHYRNLFYQRWLLYIHNALTHLLNMTTNTTIQIQSDNKTINRAIS